MIYTLSYTFKKHYHHILILFKSSAMSLIILAHIPWVTKEVGQVFLSLLVIWIHLGLGNLDKVLEVGWRWEKAEKNWKWP